MPTQSVELPVQSYQSLIYLLCTDSADNGDPTRTGPAHHLASAGGQPGIRYDPSISDHDLPGRGASSSRFEPARG